MVDAREVAPRAATRDMFLDANGDVVQGRSTSTALAAGIPGEPAGFDYVSKTYGKLPFKTVRSVARHVGLDAWRVAG